MPNKAIQPIANAPADFLGPLSVGNESMKLSDKKTLQDPIILLWFFSLIMGMELGSLSKNLESHGSIILVEPLFSFGNLIWFYFAVSFLYFSFREEIKVLKIACILGGISFIFTETVVAKIGYKSLYAIKILLLFAVTMLLLNHLLKIKKLYRSVPFQNE